MHKLFKIFINLILITSSLISLSNTNHKIQDRSLLKNKPIIANNSISSEILNTNIKEYFDQVIIQIYNLDDAKAKIIVIIENIIFNNFTDGNKFRIINLELKNNLNNFNQWSFSLNIFNNDNLILSSQFDIKLQYIINLDNYFSGKKVYFEQFYHQKSNTERILLVREINSYYEVDVLTFDYKIKNAISDFIILGTFKKVSDLGSFALGYNYNYIRLFYYYNQFLQTIELDNDLNDYSNEKKHLSYSAANVENYYNDQSQVHINFTNQGYSAYVSDVSEKKYQINSQYIFGSFFHATFTLGNTVIVLPNIEPLYNKYLLFSGNYILIMGYNIDNEIVGYIFNYQDQQELIKLNLNFLKTKNIIEMINWDYSNNTLSYISQVNNNLYLEIINLKNNYDLITYGSLINNYSIYRNSSNIIAAEIQFKTNLNHLSHSILKNDNTLLLLDFVNENQLTKNLWNYAFYTDI